MESHFQMKGWAARLVLRKRPKVIRNWLIPKVKDVKMFFIKVGVNIVIFCCYCWFVFVFFLCVCVFFHISLSFVIWLLVHVDSLSSTQALAVYGQVTGKPKDDPPPAGLPDPTTKDPEPSDDQTRKGSDGETEKGKPSASFASDFREVEGSSKDVHMRWKPPVSSRSHFTAAASPTRARDFWVYIATLHFRIIS